MVYKRPALVAWQSLRYTQAKLCCIFRAAINMVQAYSQEDGKVMRESFADSVIYLGGMFPPNRIARQPLTLIHGHGHLDGCREVSPGIYAGGEWA